MLEWTGEKDDISAILFFEKSSEIQDIYWEYIYIFFTSGERQLWLIDSICQLVQNWFHTQGKVSCHVD